MRSAREVVRPARQARTPVRERWQHVRDVGDSFDVGWLAGRAYAERRMAEQVAELMRVIEKLEGGS